MMHRRTSRRRAALLLVPLARLRLAPPAARAAFERLGYLMPMR
jgi:hypothetical protein